MMEKKQFFELGSQPIVNSGIIQMDVDYLRLSAGTRLQQALATLCTARLQPAVGKSIHYCWGVWLFLNYLGHTLVITRYIGGHTCNLRSLSVL